MGVRYGVGPTVRRTPRPGAAVRELKTGLQDCCSLVELLSQDCLLEGDQASIQREAFRSATRRSDQLRRKGDVWQA